MGFTVLTRITWNLEVLTSFPVNWWDRNTLFEWCDSVFFTLWAYKLEGQKYVDTWTPHQYACLLGRFITRCRNTDAEIALIQKVQRSRWYNCPDVTMRMKRMKCLQRKNTLLVPLEKKYPFLYSYYFFLEKYYSIQFCPLNSYVVTE